MEKFLSCKQTAARYSVKVITVREWIKSSKLPAVKIGKLYRIRESDLLAFEKANKTTEQ